MAKWALLSAQSELFHLAVVSSLPKVVQYSKLLQKGRGKKVARAKGKRGKEWFSSV
jgi:hypothetical protein